MVLTKRSSLFISLLLFGAYTAQGAEGYLTLELGGSFFQVSNSAQNNASINAAPLGGASLLGLDLRFSDRTALTLSGSALAAPVRVNSGITEQDSPYIYGTGNIGLKFIRERHQLHFVVGAEYIPVLESETLGVIRLPTTLAVSGLVDFGWKFLQGPSHDLWLHLRAGYLHGLQSSASQTFDHGVKYGAEVNFNLIEGGIPFGMFARSENDFLFTTHGTQKSVRFVLGIRLFTRLANPKTSRGRKYLTTGN